MTKGKWRQLKVPGKICNYASITQLQGWNLIMNH